jgi:hypothetical protein
MQVGTQAGLSEETMPKKDAQYEHVPGVGQKEQREYEHIKESAEKSGRYGGRAEAVAARTVLKHHKEEHHKPSE